MKRLLTVILSIVFVALCSVTAFAATAYTTDNVRVRKEASKSAQIIDVLKKGTKIDYIEAYDKEWSKINYKGATCFIATEYIKVEAENAKQESTETAAQPAAETAGANVAAGNQIGLNPSWQYADFSAIHSGAATLYKATSNRKGIVVGVNAGHGTSGGASVKTFCHPDQTPKVTGGSTAKGATKATAVSAGMTFNDGTPEEKVTLREAQILKDVLLSRGYDVLMIRDGDDVQLDNVARTVICNNAADCHIAIHWDGDGLAYDKGCFFSSVPDGIKYLPSVASTWEKSEQFGSSLIAGLQANGAKIRGNGSQDIDLTQTSYSTVPSVDIELGNQCSDHSDAALQLLAKGLADGVDKFFNK